MATILGKSLQKLGLPGENLKLSREARQAIPKLLKPFDKVVYEGAVKHGLENGMYANEAQAKQRLDWCIINFSNGELEEKLKEYGFTMRIRNKPYGDTKYVADHLDIRDKLQKLL